MKLDLTSIVRFDHLATNRVIGVLMRDIRLESNITDELAARCVGLSVEQLRKYESGSSSVSLVLFLQVAIAYNFDIGTLFSKLVLRLQDIDERFAGHNADEYGSFGELLSIYGQDFEDDS